MRTHRSLAWCYRWCAPLAQYGNLMARTDPTRIATIHRQLAKLLEEQAALHRQLADEHEPKGEGRGTPQKRRPRRRRHEPPTLDDKDVDPEIAALARTLERGT